MKKLNKSLLLGAALAALMGAVQLTPSVALAYDVTSASPVNVDAQGVGLRGYDPVAYFTEGAPAVGNSDFSAEHEGATYWFASAGNRDAFVAEPDRYAPAYGGFCQTGAVFEKKLDGDPELWRIGDDGRLFLYISVEARDAFLSDLPGNTTAADANWPLIENRAPQDLN
ncbi:YHS domain-containing (seleno)protein [Tabrizicola sp. TH137]|uniref:YHS domain-containing (seleno)protein n=1 Tax=Tabrizicola sp. TH137 TaxID=2067452 RepID=UPI001C1F5E5C|nr:YHS domain-containing (seleno)protein [Tabrizicola sp. TH137]